jgi:hypothetical protein
MNRIALPAVSRSRLAAISRNSGRPNVGVCRQQLQLHQQKRSLYFALPVLLPAALATFVGITFWQVYKRRQAEEEAAKKGVALKEPEKEKNDDPRLR